MKLRRIAIHRLPGIAPGFTLDGFGDGVNVIVGPNASGKSSLPRALRAVLYPPERRADGAEMGHVEACFEGRDGGLAVTRMGRTAAWARDGQRIESPPLPDRRFVACYTLHLEDLLASDGGTDADIARHIARELAGGYDLDATRRECGFSVPARIGQTEARDLAAADQALRAVQRAHRELQQQEDRLASLDHERREAEAASRDAALVERALRLLALSRERSDIERRRDALPPNLDRLSGDEAERLTRLREERRSVAADLARAEADQRAAARNAAETGLVGSALDDGRIADHRPRIARLRKIEDEIGRERTGLAEAMEARSAAAAELGSGPARHVHRGPDAMLDAESDRGTGGATDPVLEAELTSRHAHDPDEMSATDPMFDVEAGRGVNGTADVDHGGEYGAGRPESLPERPDAESDVKSDFKSGDGPDDRPDDGPDDEPGGRSDAPVRLDPETIHTVDLALGEHRRIVAEMRAVEAELDRLPETDAPGADRPDPNRDAEVLRDARRELVHWLAAASGGGAGRRSASQKATGGLIALAALTVLAVAGALVAGLLAHLAWLLLLPAIATAALIAWVRMRRRDSGARQRTEAQRRYLTLGVDAPAQWDAACVESHLLDLDRALVDALRHVDQRRQREEAERKRVGLDTARKREHAKLAAIARRVNFDPERLDASFDRWLRLTERYDRAHAALIESRARLDTLARDAHSIRTAIVTFLTEHDEAPPIAASGNEGAQSGAIPIDSEVTGEDVPPAASSDESGPGGDPHRNEPLGIDPLGIEPLGGDPSTEGERRGGVSDHGRPGGEASGLHRSGEVRPGQAGSDDALPVSVPPAEEPPAIAAPSNVAMPRRPAPDAEMLEQRLNRLAERLRRRDEAHRAEAAAGETRERLTDALHKCEAAVETLFRAAGLAPEDDAELRRRLECLDDWRSLGRELDQARGAAEELIRGELGDRADLLAEVEADDEIALRRRHETLSTTSARVEALAEEITRISTLVDQTSKGHGLEEARAARQHAEDALRRRFEDANLAHLGAFVLDRIEAEHVEVSRPAVLFRARDWFGRFTRHAFELDLSPNDAGAFRARETVSREWRTLSELSSGTRMQLLLAVRIAFALEAEKGRIPLPLFLDEALTTADPERFQAAAESLQRFAEEDGRQIFYLTAQPDEARYWAHADPVVIDLSESRRIGRTIARPSEVELPPAAPQPPAPDGLSAQEYAVRIGALPVNAWETPSGIHVFHLLRDDLALLHRLLCGGIERLGPLAALLASDEAMLLLSDSERTALRLRVAGAEAWVEALRVGRGRPVDRDALAASDAVSPIFMDRLVEIADETEGDAHALLKAIDEGHVPHFRTEKRRQLEEWFLEHGHLDRTDPYDTHGIVRRIAQALLLHDAPPDTALDEAARLARAMTAGLAREVQPHQA